MRAPTGHSPTAELERSAPRDVTLTNGGRTLILLAWLLAAGAAGGGVALYLEAGRQSDAWRDFHRRGVAASAVVDRLWRKSGDGKPAFAAFHFDAGGVRVDGESRMQLSAWRELRTGSELPVRYLPDNPRQFAVAGQRRRGGMPFALSYIVSSVLAALALLCVAAVRRQRYLLSEGRSAPALVTAVRKTRGSNGETHREMTYEFRVLAGTMATGKTGATKLSAVGDRINVVYDPEQPKRNRPYPFPLVTLNREW